MLTLADNHLMDINAWISQNILRKSRAAVLSNPATALIENPVLLENSLSVVKILRELNAGANLLVAGLVYEPFHKNEINSSTIKKIFGTKVHKLVLEVQKIDLMLKSGASKGYQYETIEKSLQNLDKMLQMSLETSQAIVIRLAIQVCIMRDAVHEDKNTKIHLANQTLKIFTPLAKRLNIGRINWELEDLAFKYLNPDTYKTIAKLLDERRIEREKYIFKTKQQLEESLKLRGIEGKVYGRAKHIYSIWNKMRRKMTDYNGVNDVHALRIIVPNVIDCYIALGVVHTLWRHVPQKLDDYISNPKINGYKSLHTKIITLDERILEVQIRTQQMHQQAEAGIAAHWRYKEQM